jgi:phosphate:Na+ symporter
LIPDRPIEEEGLVVTAKYLEPDLLKTPAFALDRVRMEMLNMGERVQAMVDKIMPAILSGNKNTLTEIREMDDEVDILYEQILEYMGGISKGTLTEAQTQELLNLMTALSELENIGDTVETNLVDLGNDRIDAGFSISESTAKVLNDFHDVVKKALSGAILAVAHNSPEAAQEVIKMKDEITDLAESAAAHQASRLVAEEPNRIAAYTTEIDIIEKQKRIYYFSKRMAKTVLAPDEQIELEAEAR